MKTRSSPAFLKFRQKISFLSLRCFFWGMGVLPRGFVSFCSDKLFALVYLVLDKQKEICSRNLRSVYGESYDAARYQSMTRACIKFISSGMLALLYYVQRPRQLMQVVRIDHEEYLKAALAKGKGVIAVSAHLGNIPLLFVALTQMGYKINVIIRPMRDKDFSLFMHDLCARIGINMIETVPPRNFIKKSFQVLHKNELLFILLDEVVEDEFAVKVDFFNQQVNRAMGPVLFHERTGAPVVPVFMVEDQDKNFQIYVHKEMEMLQGQDPAESNIINISNLTVLIEDYVRRFPQQWGGWLNKRWRKDKVP